MSPQAPRDLGTQAPLARFAVAIFASALLMFCVEPLVGKMLQPLLGGAPAVWTTCMVFFQFALLAGYAYAHAITRVLAPRAQVALHLALLAASLALLPIAIDDRAVAGWPTDRDPSLRLLALLCARLGAPFLVLAATSPLLQQWFSRLGHRSAKDPYFLYVASNGGSMLALLAYPVAIEPRLGIARQGRVWAIGYVGLALLVASCALAFLRASPRAAAPDARSDAEGADAPEPPPTRARRLRWVLLAFAPSSLLLGTTTYVTTDVAGIPLFWIAPLAVYLLSFILVFARRPPVPHAVAVRYLPLAASTAVLTLVAQAGRPALLLVTCHLATLFFAAMVCHGELARDRPAPAHLTEFYLLLSLGGVLGGIFVGLAAPLLFDRLAEYPLAIVLGCLLAPPAASAARGAASRARADLLVPLGVGLGAAALILLGLRLHLPFEGRAFMALLGAPLLANYATRARPRRFALGLLGVVCAGALFPGIIGQAVLRERSFYGVVRVAIDPTGRFRQIAHGNVVHGRQSLDPAHEAEPTAYYARSGPLGDLFEARARATAADRVGVIGLGTGAMAAYARAGERWTFFELNPVMARLARDPRYFGFLARAFPDGRGLAIELGDARLRLRDAPPNAFDLLVLDAFSSDAIPAHLLTREALRLYESKLAPGGLLVLHLSNVYLDLVPVVADLAADAGLSLFVREDLDLTAAEAEAGKIESRWGVLVRDERELHGLLERHRAWKRAPAGHGRPWTDDYTNLLAAIAP